MVAVGDHLVFFLAVEEVVIVLHRDELVEVVFGCKVLEFLEFPRGHGGGADPEVG